MAAAPRNMQAGGGSGGPGWQFGDTTYTKIFVGGLAWETRRDSMRRYFEQFGEILEAVVITDKNTGRSKGYGFVTFKDAESASRACIDANPVIDGRRANCNLAILGASSNRNQQINPQIVYGRNRSFAGQSLPASAYITPAATAGYFQPSAQFAYPSVYSYTGAYSQEGMYPVSYYSVSGGGSHPQLPASYYTGAAAGSGVYHNYYQPYYTQYPPQSTHSSSGGGGGYGVQYSQLLQYPYLPQHYAGGIVPLPISIAPTTGMGSAAMASPGPGSSGQTPSAAEQRPPPS